MVSSPGRIIDIEATDTFPPTEVPEEAVETTLKVLRTLRRAAEEVQNHDTDIRCGQMISILTRLAFNHNAEVRTHARRQQDQTPNVPPPDPNGELGSGHV